MCPLSTVSMLSIIYVENFVFFQNSDTFPLKQKELKKKKRKEKICLCVRKMTVCDTSFLEYMVQELLNTISWNFMLTFIFFYLCFCDRQISVFVAWNYMNLNRQGRYLLLDTFIQFVCMYLTKKLFHRDIFIIFERYTSPHLFYPKKKQCLNFSACISRAVAKGNHTIFSLSVSLLVPHHTMYGELW